MPKGGERLGSRRQGNGWQLFKINILQAKTIICDVINSLIACIAGSKALGLRLVDSRVLYFQRNEAVTKQ